MHGSPISNVDAGRKSSGNRHPTDGNGLRPARRHGRATKFGPESALDEGPQGLSQFSRPLLGGDEQVIGEINSRLHTGKHIPVFMARPSTSSPDPCHQGRQANGEVRPLPAGAARPASDCGPSMPPSPGAIRVIPRVEGSGIPPGGRQQRFVDDLLTLPPGRRGRAACPGHDRAARRRGRWRRPPPRRGARPGRSGEPFPGRFRRARAS